MSVSAFGIEHGDFSKANDKSPSAGRYATGMVFPGAHGAIAGKKGKKLSAFGNETGRAFVGSAVGGSTGLILSRGKSVLGTVGGALGGSAAGVRYNQRKGNYKPGN